MRNVFTILTLLLIISSCSRNEYEKDLIGTWNNFPVGGRLDFTFYKDSVVSYEYSEKRVGKWKADACKIYVFHSKEISGYKKSDTLYYEFNLGKDSLFVKNDTLVYNSFYSLLLKVEDVWEHHLKEINLKVKLPNANFDLISNNSKWKGIDLYLAHKNDSLIIKNNSGIQLNLLKDIRLLVFSKRTTIREEEFDKMSFNLIVDEKVSEQKVDSIKGILKQFPKMKTFRVFKNDTANYGKYDVTNKGERWYWYGRYE